MYTGGEVHGLGTSSIIKQANDNFYTSVLSSYTSYIDTNIGFCGDRSLLSSQSGVGTEKTITYYNGYLRVTSSKPTLSCENSSDLYTVSSSNIGNKVLTYPVGLITADEVILSGSGGGFFSGTYNYQQANSNGYLITGNTFWTITPVGYFVAFGGATYTADVFKVLNTGYIDDDVITRAFGLRPVINIRSDVTVSGDGTISSPYEFSLT